MFIFLDARDENQGPKPYNSWYFVFYFVTFILIGKIYKL
jgi:hypothetical protein